MTDQLLKAGERLYADHMLVERSGDGWIASYRFDPIQGSSGKLRTVSEALEWLRRMEATRGRR